GISTAANVPQLIMLASCHHKFGIAKALINSPPAPVTLTDKSLSSSQLMPKEVVMHRIDAIQISRVRGWSKSNSRRPLYFFSDVAGLKKYEQPDMKSIRKRIAKIQTMSLAWRSR